MMAAMYDWSGFYVGANGGWGSSHNCWTRTATLGVAIACRSPKVATTRPAARSVARFGYRWQAGTWVFGLEAQGNWADFRGSNASLLFGGATNRTKIDAFGLFTGQVGYAWNNALFYVKGGAAVTDNRYEGLVTVDRLRDRSRFRHPLGRHGRRRRRIRLCAELVGRDRIRPSVHGHQQQHLHQRVPGGRLQHPHRRHQAGCRSRHGARQLSLWWPGRREVLISRYQRNSEKAGLAPAFFVGWLLAVHTLYVLFPLV